MFFFDFSVVNVSSGNPAEYSVSAAVQANSETIGSAASYGHYQFLPDKNFQNLVVVSNNPKSGTYDVALSGLTHFVNGVSSPYSYGDAYLQFLGAPGQYNLSSNTLPPLDFYRSFPLSGVTFVSFITGPKGESDVSGTVNSVTAQLVSPVPEASTTVSLGVMLGLGGLVLAVRARRRSRVRHTRLVSLVVGKATFWLLTAAVLLSLAGSASAQTTINFGAAQTSAADADVLNTGTTFLAFAFDGPGSTVTVNGVTFTDAGTGTVGNLTTSSFNAGFSGFTSASAPFSNLSASYQSLLSGGIYVAPPAPATFTISGLTTGNQYEAQFFVSDPRIYGANRAETLTGGTTLSYNSTGQDGGVGQFADSNIFTADASGKATFTVISSATSAPSGQATQVNAFQVRDLGASPVPEAPTTVSLGVMLGLGGLLLAARARRRSRA